MICGIPDLKSIHRDTPKTLRDKPDHLTLPVIFFRVPEHLHHCTQIPKLAFMSWSLITSPAFSFVPTQHSLHTQELCILPCTSLIDPKHGLLQLL
jgi:hypothetical protein